MRFGIFDVYFPQGVRDTMYARGIDEEMVLRALTAEADAGDAEPLVTGEWIDKGQPDLWVLAQDPISGRYLEIGFVMQPDGVARCYHAMTMRDSHRKRYQGQR